MTTWPEWFPENCPPATAAPATGTFYRLVEEETVTRDDFRSVRELLRLGLKSRQYWSDEEESNAVACSVHAVIDDAEKTRKSIGALKNRRIAQGEIDGDGRVLHTPSRLTHSHHSWWRPVDDEAWQTFEVVA
jgi:hypothetical protein